MIKILIQAKYILLLLLVCLGFAPKLQAQKVRFTGVVKSNEGDPLPGANVFLHKSNVGSSTNTNGQFSFETDTSGLVRVAATFIGYDTAFLEENIGNRSSVNLQFTLRPSLKTMRAFVVEDEQLRQSTMIRIDAKQIDQLPTPNASIEKTLQFQGLGVMSNNEMSSQYNVRGGSFDENLVYVNDVLIYRPFLVRAGQQEGLSFLFPKLIANVFFSSGGFDAKYGDKMSSVLDVKYKEPARRFGGSAEASFLGGAVHLEHSTENHRFKQIHGVRYRTNQYLLGSLEVQGDYQPNFTDYQGFLSYDVTEKFKLGFLANYSRNRYLFIPETRQTDFGTINEALRLTVFFDGQELNAYETMVGALTAEYKPRNNLNLKWIASAYRSVEREEFDVEGAYRLDELDRDLGSDNFGNVAFSRGSGGIINHARNFLEATVATLEHKGNYTAKKYHVDWGAQGSLEDIKDDFSEWQMLDSSGYSLPQPPPFSPRNTIELDEVVRNSNSIQSFRTQGYAQVRKLWVIDSNEISLSAGGRFHYWSFNQQLVGGPRVNLSWKPNWEKNILFKAAWGYYHQPAFYREMRDLQGNINPDIKAQTSIHYLVGMDVIFEMWNRPFKFQTEVYYKHLQNLIPYEIDNVRLRYYATNNAVGYATGIDLKLNGEFVPGVESWISMSVMKTAEDLRDDFYYLYFDSEGNRTRPGSILRPLADSQRVEPGYIPRPTDQRVNFNLFFQDYLPNNPTLKMNLSLVFGTGLPFGPPTYERYRDTLRIPPYRRVDLGMSKQLIKPINAGRKQNKFTNGLKHIETAWLSLEVFNLLQVNNTISYLWVRDISSRQYAIPNYLTSRRVNLRLIIDF